MTNEIPADLQTEIDRRFNATEALAPQLAADLRQLADAAEQRGWNDVADLYRQAADLTLEGEGAQMMNLINQANHIVDIRASTSG